MTEPPIPVPDPDAGVLTFRCKFLHYWIATTFGSLAWSLPIILVIIPITNPLLIISMNTLAACVTCGFLCLLLIVTTPTKVQPDTIRSTNFWGKTAQVEWQNISSVKRINHLTLPYIKISTPYKKNIIWLPLFLADPQGLRDAVADFTPPDHPLRLALEKEFPK